MSKKKLGLFCVIFSVMQLNLSSQENRSIDGIGNNLNNIEWGASHTEMPRITEVNYTDGVSAINDANLPNPRYISNKIFSQSDLINSDMSLSDFVWAFGQFIDHDISLVQSSSERMNILLPPGEEVFTAPIPVNRSLPMPNTGVDRPRQYSNSITSFIDGSMIYGSDLERASWIRRNDGSGKLKTSHNGKFLPFNTKSGEYNSSDIDPSAPFMDDGGSGNQLLFVAGDIRANENPMLLSLHTLFMLEHNRKCDKLKAAHPNWTGDQIYERARKYVGAYIQSITYNEWLPSMGVELPSYSEYKNYINPSISNLFSAAAFRIGHTLINSNIVRMDDSGKTSEEGNMSLKDSYFNPQEILTSNSIEPFIKGMGTQMQQEMDCKVVDDLRNFLFGPPGVGLDLVSINIFRGRERGLPSYSQIREQIGLARVEDFFEITWDEEPAQVLEEMYESVDNIDAWVGFLSEKHMEGKLFGRTTNKILMDQFQALREGDRFYYESDPAFSSQDIDHINNTTLRDIIMRNTSISLMQKNVFVAMPHDDIPSGPELLNLQLEATIYPNPVNSNSLLKVYAEFESEVEVRVFNTQGLVVREFTMDLHTGENLVSLDLPQDIIKGFYSIHLSSGSYSNVIKVVKE